MDIDAAVNQAAHRIWIHAAAFDEARGSLRAWFYSVARNCALMTLRDRRRGDSVRYVRELDALAAAPAPDQVEPPLSAVDRKFRDDFHECVAELPRLQRLVLLADLAAGGAAPAKQLEKELGTTANSIYVSRTNARKALREMMKERGHD